MHPDWHSRGHALGRIPSHARPEHHSPCPCAPRASSSPSNHDYPHMILVITIVIIRFVLRRPHRGAIPANVAKDALPPAELVARRPVRLRAPRVQEARPHRRRAAPPDRHRHVAVEARVRLCGPQGARRRRRLLAPHLHARAAGGGRGGGRHPCSASLLSSFTASLTRTHSLTTESILHRRRRRGRLRRLLCLCAGRARLRRLCARACRCAATREGTETRLYSAVFSHIQESGTIALVFTRCLSTL